MWLWRDELRTVACCLSVVNVTSRIFLSYNWNEISQVDSTTSCNFHQQNAPPFEQKPCIFIYAIKCGRTSLFPFRSFPQYVSVATVTFHVLPESGMHVSLSLLYTRQHNLYFIFMKKVVVSNKMWEQVGNTYSLCKVTNANANCRSHYRQPSSISISSCPLFTLCKTA
jgi:hypothetical protein